MDVTDINPATKPAFEPSELVDHGDVAELTQDGAGGAVDGPGYS